jgi:hypothetical protein
MRRTAVVCLVVAVVLALAAATVMAIGGHVPRATVGRVITVSAQDAANGAWMYNAEQNLCYPMVGLGFAGWVQVDTCPVGSFRGYLYNMQTFECTQYPQDLGVAYTEPWVWRSACPGPGPAPPGCPDPREQTPVDVTGIVKADGFSVRALQSPPGASTPCNPGDMRLTSEGIFLCVGIDSWGKAVLTLP